MEKYKAAGCCFFQDGPQLPNRYICQIRMTTLQPLFICKSEEAQLYGHLD